MLDAKSSQEKEVLTPSELALGAINEAGLIKRVTRHEFKAMGTLFYFVAVDACENLFSILESRVRELEKCWTRYSSNSELMKLNLSSGTTVQVSDDLLNLIREMQHGYELTDGLFDPSILSEMMKLGFTTEDSTLNSQLGELSNTVGFSGIEVDTETHSVTLPLGVGIDAGGIGKGLAADMIAELAITQSASGIAVFAGGEVSVRGSAPSHEGWTIGVENPWVADDMLDVIALHNGGVATSSIEARTVGEFNHLINPKNGLNFDTDVVQATVLCERAVDAEILAKACFAYNCQESIVMIEQAGAQALLVDRDGSIYRSLGWEDFS